MRSLDAIAQQLAFASTRSGNKKKSKQTRLTGDWSVNLGSGAKVGAGRFPAKFSFNPDATPNCSSDFVVFNTSLTGSPSQASVIAFNQLYATTCGTAPAVYWAYNTGGMVNNSVVLSADGSQVAFIHSGTPPSLVILKWKAGQGTSASSPMSSNGTTFISTSTASTYVSCKTTSNACQLTLPFFSYTFANDSLSSPFYDYTNDILYVGDDGGALHKFTGVFNGTPAEVGSGSPWQTIENGTALTSPVVDYGAATPTIYIGEYKTGYVDYVTTSGTNHTRSGHIGFNTNVDIKDAPVVDATAGKIYVAVAADSAGNNAIYMFNRGFAGGNTGSEAIVGTGSLTNSVPLLDGDFDQVYYASSNATGNLYVCGDTGGSAKLYQVPINAGIFGSALTGPTLSSASITCSPVTEIYNTAASDGPFDWIFLSVQGSGALANCAGGGCVMSFTVTQWQANTAYSLNQEVLDTNLNIEKVTTAGTSGASPPSWNISSGGVTADGSGTLVWTNQGSMATNAASRAEAGGTSGIIIDNVSTTTGASQVYFSTLSNGSCGGGCAVQASQSGLN